MVAVGLGRELVSVAAFADPGIGAFASWGVEPGEEFIDRAGEVVSFRAGDIDGLERWPSGLRRRFAKPL